MVYLGGLKEYIPEIRRCRRLLLIGEYFYLNFTFGMGRGEGTFYSLEVNVGPDKLWITALVFVTCNIHDVL